MPVVLRCFRFLSSSIPVALRLNDFEESAAVLFDPYTWKIKKLHLRALSRAFHKDFLFAFLFALKYVSNVEFLILLGLTLLQQIAVGA